MDGTQRNLSEKEIEWRDMRELKKWGWKLGVSGREALTGPDWVPCPPAGQGRVSTPRVVSPRLYSAEEGPFPQRHTGVLSPQSTGMDADGKYQ